MKKYLFISNSTKPTEEVYKSREKINFGNVTMPCLTSALEMGAEVWCGVNRLNPESIENNLGVHLYDSNTYRSLFNFKDNYIAYKNTMKVIKENSIDAIHCNTPIGGIIGRLCGKIAGVKNVIYTAHGFHFYKGAPLINRTVFKWAEMFMAHWTDAIITMNKEDYEAANKFKLRNKGHVYYVPGVGIDTESYKNVKVDREALRTQLKLKNTDIVCISMGDLIVRKNYETAIRAISQCKNKNIHYLICGKGPEESKLKQLAIDLNVDEKIHFLGYRTDIKQLLKISDIFLFTTLQEGMPRSMMEAMASGLPCIASAIRGNIDLLEDEKGGFLVPVYDIEKITNRIDLLAQNTE